MSLADLTPAAILLALVTLERLGELPYAEANRRRLLAAGAREVGAAHYPFMVALHAAWLGGLWWLGRGQPLQPAFVVLYALLQLGRLWVMASLGRRWTTRVLVVPGETLVARGPYRFVNHPNYLVVAGEIAVLPLALGLPLYALIFSILNGIVLWIRISVEGTALRPAGRAGPA